VTEDWEEGAILRELVTYFVSSKKAKDELAQATIERDNLAQQLREGQQVELNEARAEITNLKQEVSTTSEQLDVLKKKKNEDSNAEVAQLQKLLLDQMQKLLGSAKDTRDQVQELKHLQVAAEMSEAKLKEQKDEMKRLKAAFEQMQQDVVDCMAACEVVNDE